MNQIFGVVIQSVLLMSLFILANTQRSSNNYRDVGVHELERQNKITKQILQAFIQKKLGLRNNSYRAPSVFEILPMPTLVTTKRPEPVDDPEEEVQDQDNVDSKESQEYNDSESLQSVESEQINSIYNTEGRTKKYASGPPFEPELEPTYYNMIKWIKMWQKQVVCVFVLMVTWIDSTATIAYQNQVGNGLGKSECSSCSDDELGVTRWTMPLLKSGEKKYYLGIFFKANWFKAQQYCRFHGMHLASISSQQENDKLEQYVKDSGYGREHFWTSGTDLAEEGNFFWMANGRPLTFVNWNAGEPNNFRYENGEEENCLELWNRDDKGLKWNDSPCSFETYFICEVRSD